MPRTSIQATPNPKGVSKEISAANGLLSQPEKKGRVTGARSTRGGGKQGPQPSSREHAESEAGQRYGPGGGWGDEEFDDLFS